MKLIYIQTKQPLAEIEGNQVLFLNEALDKDMKQNGIGIPKHLRHLYNNRDTIFPREADFTRAFVDIYLRYHLDTWNYRWV